MQSLFLLLLPRLLIFALFSSLISFSTHKHTKTTAVQRKVNYMGSCFVLFFMLISGLRQCISLNVPDQKLRSRITLESSDHGTSKGPLYPI